MAKNKKLPILPRGMGNFEYLPSGSIRYRKYIKDSAGNRKRYAVIGETVEECMEEMKKIEKGSSAYERKKWTLDEALHYWAKNVKGQKTTPQAYDRFMKTVEYLSDYKRCHMAKMRYRTIPLEEFNKHLNVLNDRELSHSEILKHYHLLKRFYHDMSYLDDFKDPTVLLEMIPKGNIKRETKKVQYLNDEDIKKFCNAALAKKTTDGTPFYKYGPALAANIWMGLRVGELIALTWEDIDLEEKQVSVTKTYITKPTPKIQEYTKTKEGRRIPLSKSAKKFLEIYRERTGKTTGPIMETDGGRRPDEQQIWKMTKAIQKRAETSLYIGTIENWKEFVKWREEWEKDGCVPRPGKKEERKLWQEKRTEIQSRKPKLRTIKGSSDGGTHVIRHTTARILFDARIPLPIIASFLGHSVEVLQSTYLSIIPDDYKAIVKAMDNVFDDIDL